MTRRQLIATVREIIRLAMVERRRMPESLPAIGAFYAFRLAAWHAAAPLRRS